MVGVNVTQRGTSFLISLHRFIRCLHISSYRFFWNTVCLEYILPSSNLEIIWTSKIFVSQHAFVDSKLLTSNCTSQSVIVLDMLLSYYRPMLRRSGSNEGEADWAKNSYVEQKP